MSTSQTDQLQVDSFGIVNHERRCLQQEEPLINAVDPSREEFM